MKMHVKRHINEHLKRHINEQVKTHVNKHSILFYFEYYIRAFLIINITHFCYEKDIKINKNIAFKLFFLNVTMLSIANQLLNFLIIDLI